MSDARWEKVARLFEEALERRAGERGRYLDAHCRDPAVRREVEAMLRGHERAEGILERSLAEVAGVAGVGESEPVRVPEWAGPYHILEEIGRGGMGVVFRAHDPRLDRLVAVKVLPGTSADGERFRSRVLAEARAASALDHPNVCTVHDVGETAEGLAFIVMAFYPGKTLAVRLAEGRLEALQALDVAEQVAHGLQHAHGNGIVHRDVKPSNLLITDRGDVKILDFGIAQSRGVLAVPQRVGTAAYMSPEQLRGEPLDPRTDLWSLGVVLYEMLTGRRPFEAGGDPATLVRGILEGPPPPLPPWRASCGASSPRSVVIAARRRRSWWQSCPVSGRRRHLAPRSCWPARRPERRRRGACRSPSPRSWGASKRSRR
jgi:serine/threonine protein kinase